MDRLTLTVLATQQPRAAVYCAPCGYTSGDGCIECAACALEYAETASEPAVGVVLPNTRVSRDCAPGQLCVTCYEVMELAEGGWTS